VCCPGVCCPGAALPSPNADQTQHQLALYGLTLRLPARLPLLLLLQARKVAARKPAALAPRAALEDQRCATPYDGFK
jgi:hypothetical protein